MNNISKIIHSHDKKIIAKLLLRDKGTNTLLCNCRFKEECPIGGKCNEENVNILLNEGNFKDKVYIGVSTLN